MSNQEPKDQKPLSDKELEQAAGGGAFQSASESGLEAIGIEAGGGAGGANPDTVPSTGDVDPGLAASGMDAETYYAIFPAARPLPNQGPQ